MDCIYSSMPNRNSLPQFPISDFIFQQKYFPEKKGIFGFHLQDLYYCWIITKKINHITWMLSKISDIGAPRRNKICKVINFSFHIFPLIFNDFSFSLLQYFLYNGWCTFSFEYYSVCLRSISLMQYCLCKYIVNGEYCSVFIRLGWLYDWIEL